MLGGNLLLVGGGPAGQGSTRKMSTMGEFGQSNTAGIADTTTINHMLDNGERWETTLLNIYLCRSSKDMVNREVK